MTRLRTIALLAILALSSVACDPGSNAGAPAAQVGGSSNATSRATSDPAAGLHELFGPSSDATGAAIGRAAQFCPRRARDAEEVVERAEVPGAYSTLHSALLCRYHHEIEGKLALDGAVLVDSPTADALHDAYRDRSLAMVDCEPQPRMPLFAVLDRDPVGRQRVVTVELALCASIAARVAGEDTYGLATRAHQELLLDAWRRGHTG